MKISSRSFTFGGVIPSRHTCDGVDVSPEISWSEAPDQTHSFALMVDDPDAPGGTFVHWVVFNIAANRGGLEEGRPPPECLQGVNDFGTSAYSGPCPPRGKPHRYKFRLFALDSRLNLPRGSTMSVVEKAMKGHILASAETMGTYGR